MFVSPHKLAVDRDGYLWLADNGGHQVFKLSQDGKVLLTLGKKGVAGAGPDEFDAPTDVAVAPNGDIFVADGHSGGGTATGNARIVKFDKDGKFLKTWGRKGMGAGEFDVIHTLAFDSRGRLFVGDRQNNRIQIFDQDGKFIAQWFQFGRPSGILHRQERRDLCGRLRIAGRPDQHRAIVAAADRRMVSTWAPNAASESEVPMTVPSTPLSRIHVRIRTPPSRAWRKASRRIPKAMYTVRISSAMSGNSCGSDRAHVI